MNMREYIIQEYKNAKFHYQYDEIDRENDEEAYLKAKQDIYIGIVKSLGHLLGTIEERSERTEAYFRATLMKLLWNVIIEEQKPKTELNELGYGYKNFEYKSDQQLIMQFMEGFLACQSIKYDVVWFLELAQKLKLIQFTK